jgi:nitrate/nitrite transporter NarK
VDAQTANILVAVSLLLGTPFFVLFGAWSDKIGRKRIIMAGCLLAALTYFPLFKLLTHFANPALEHAQRTAPVRVLADPAACSLQFNPVGTSQFTSACDVAKSALVRRGVPYENETVAGDAVVIQICGAGIASFDLRAATDEVRGREQARFDRELDAALAAAAYPPAADPAAMNRPAIVLVLWILVLYVTMVYGPIAAMLVEMFPTRIRYTSMSLPYHIGNGWFGGFLPTTSFAIVAATGNIYSGLWYPVAVATMTLVIGTLFLRETRTVDLAGNET